MKDLPTDIREPLLRRSEAAWLFERLLPSRRNHVRWINEARKPETRTRRIGSMVERLTAPRAPDMTRHMQRRILAGAFCTGAAITPALAEMDSGTRSSMQYLHKSLLLAEQNIKLAVEKKDFPRAALANELLFTYQRFSRATDAPSPCVEALNGLAGVAVAIGFAAHPVTQDPTDRFSKAMRPSEEIVAKTYIEGQALYRSKMTACEEEINYKPTPRLLPEKIPLTR